MTALKWLRMLTNHISDKYEPLVRYYGYYSNRSLRRDDAHHRAIAPAAP